MRSIKKQHIMQIKIGIFVICVFASVLLIAFMIFKNTKRDYGVFLGIDKSEIHKLNNYQTVVIDPSNFSESNIKQLHKDGKIVYGYLNVGSIEKFRSYFEHFQNLTLGPYENWPDESWINVASADWQNFIVQDLGKKYADKGIDGFFIDNTDVYYQYPTEDTFQGLCLIMKRLKNYKLKILINGGDLFVSKCMDEKIAANLFDGINQECVFTGINFNNKTYGSQDKDETKRYKKYLSKVKKFGLEIYLLEYGAGTSNQKIIDRYCKQNGIKWYNADSLELQ